MQDGWRERLRKVVGELKESSGIGMNRLSERAGLHKTYLSALLAEDSVIVPTITAFLAIAEACGVSPAYLLGIEDQAKISIPTIGIASVAEEWAAVQGVKDELAFAIHGFDLVGIEVRGNAMAPVYRDQDYLICQRRAGRFVQNLVGSDCAVCTKSDGRYLKILHKGTKPGLFTLRSYNPAAHDDVENVALDWAAPVIWIRRGGR